MLLIATANLSTVNPAKAGTEVEVEVEVEVAVEVEVGFQHQDDLSRRPSDSPVYNHPIRVLPDSP